MYQKIGLFGLIFGVLLATSACDEGKYNDLICASDFMDECISYDEYMTCENNKLVILACPEGYFCAVDAYGVSRCEMARDPNASLNSE